MTWISYAQNREDVILMRALRAHGPGFYIDVGAHHPIADSVTQAFYELGWRGINIEPVPAGHLEFLKQRPRDINLQVAVGATAGEVEFHDVPGTGLSSTDAQLAQRYRDEGLPVQRFIVPQRTLNDICEAHAPQAIHFLKIDTEGTEAQVLQGLNLQRWRPWVLVVEATAPRESTPVHQAWEPGLLDQGYTLAWFDGLNRFYLAEEHAQLLPLLAQPPHVFDHFMTHTERFLRHDVADHAELLKQARQQLAQQQQQLQHLHQELQATQQAWQHEVQALRGSRSWRLMAPVRALGRAARHLKAAKGQGASATPPAPAEDPEPWHHGRPVLALVAPLPPLPTGIAHSVAALVPALQRHFQVVLITHQPTVDDGPWRRGVPLRSPQWLQQHIAQVHRVVHHLGNSLHHQFQFPLLQALGGTVVLHDLVLTDLLHHLEATGRQPGVYTRALFHTHGWPALLHRHQQGEEATLRRYTASAPVFSAAQAVWVHSQHSRQWAQQVHGTARAPTVMPLPAVPRSVPRALPWPLAPRAWSRHRLWRALQAQLKLPPHTPAPRRFIVSFGGVHPSKCVLELARVWQQHPCRQAGAQLLFLGGGASPELQQQLQATGAWVSGHASEALYALALQGADLAVQLRRHSRGETSGAVLDALAAGLPTVVNRHAAQAEWPDAVVWPLPDTHFEAPLAQALHTLLEQPPRARALGRAARAWVQAHHTPQQVAQQQAQALATVPPPAPPRWPQPPTLWVDVTAIALQDLRSGIQRVTRSVLLRLLQRSGQGPEASPQRVQPVRLLHGQYHTAQAFTASWLGLPPDWAQALGADDQPIQPQPGDTFFGLDLVTDGVAQHHATFHQWRQRGVRLLFFVHDLLPLQHPQWFPAPDTAHFQGWWRTVATQAHVLLCNSKATAQAVQQQLAQEQGTAPPQVQAVPLGAHIEGTVPTTGLSPQHQALLQQLQTAPGPLLLAVGTIEPRKGIEALLDACDTLWAQGWAGRLWLLGRAGWQVEALVQRLQQHPQRQQRLHWTTDASDELLQRAYTLATALVMPSRAEGYGLPMVEALQAGLPVWARRLPVFEEVAQAVPGTPAHFWGPDDAALAPALAGIGPGRPPAPSHRPPAPSWDDTVQALLPWLSTR